MKIEFALGISKRLKEDGLIIILRCIGGLARQYTFFIVFFIYH